MGSETKGCVLDLHHDDQTRIDLKLCGLAAKDEIQYQQERAKIQKLACLAITGAMKMTPRAAMEVLLGLPALHVMIEAEAQTGVYRIMCTQQWRPLTSVTPKNLGMWSTNPSYRWGLTGCYKDMYTTSHY